MRGQLDPKSSMFHYFSPESRVPAEHPLRKLKSLAERALGAVAAELDTLYSETGRPSILAESLLKGQLLIALYSIRSDRQFCEQLGYKILFRWFLDMDLESVSLEPSNSSRLRERLVATDLVRGFFDELVSLARRDHADRVKIPRLETKPPPRSIRIPWLPRLQALLHRAANVPVLRPHANL
jgi:transposase